MPRKEDSKMCIENKRAHVVRLSAEYIIPSLGRITIGKDEYQTIYKENKFVRMAINGNFLSAKLKGK